MDKNKRNKSLKKTESNTPATLIPDKNVEINNSHFLVYLTIIKDLC